MPEQNQPNRPPAGPNLKARARGRGAGKRVRCLGVGKEHAFVSHSPAERICGSCRAVIDARLRKYSPRAFEVPTPDPKE